MIAQDYHRFGGVYGESAAVRNVLAHLGVVAPHTGQPFSEAMLFGISGGIGFAYRTFRYRRRPAMPYIGVTHGYGSMYGERMDGLYDLLNVEATVRTTRRGKVAKRQLKGALGQGQPVILHVDSAELPFLSESMVHALVAYGYDQTGDLVLIADRALVPVAITAQTLATARASLATLRHRSTTLRPPPVIEDVRGAIIAGLRNCYVNMAHPPQPIGSFGLNGLRKWATLVYDSSHKRGWPRLFPPGRRLYLALYWTFMWIETVETGGGALRWMYADFLEEASDVLAQPELRGVAEQYRAGAQLWRDLAHAVLPDEVPLFKEAKNLAYRKERLFIEKGGAALPQIAEIGRRQSDIEAAVDDAFPLNARQIDRLLSALLDHILRVFDAEQRAIETLQVISKLEAERGRSSAWTEMRRS